MFKDKTILYIVHNYNSFQKDPIEEIAKNFKKVYVLVRYKPISKFARFIPFKWLKRFDDKYVIDLTNKPKNVEVIKTPVWYLPYGVFYKWLGELHFRAVDKVIKRNNIEFDLVHSHFLWSAGYVGMKLKEKYNKPFVVTGHGFDVYELPSRSVFWETRVKEILKNADKIITVSEKNRTILKDLGIDKEKILLLGNSFNNKIFFPLDMEKCRDDLGIDKDKKVLVSVGNLEKVKGHKYLIEAINILKNEYPEIVCYIIGGGSLLSSLNEQIKTLGLVNRVILVGHIEHNQVQEWLNASDIFVLPSISESFGIVQLEAFACEKPVVATKNEGSREIIISDNYGLLCNLEDAQDLSEKICQALKKKWEPEKIKRYSDNFSQDTMNKRLLNLYEDILKETYD